MSEAFGANAEPCRGHQLVRAAPKAAGPWPDRGLCFTFHYKLSYKLWRPRSWHKSCFSSCSRRSSPPPTSTGSLAQHTYISECSVLHPCLSSTCCLIRDPVRFLPRPNSVPAPAQLTN